MSRIKQPPLQLLSAAAANGIGIVTDVSDYRFIILTVFTTGSTAATIKFAISNELKSPVFSSAPSATNVYDFVAVTPLNNQTTPLPGSTGIALTGTAVIAMYEVDANYIHWLCPIVSGYSAGTITVELTACNDFSK